MRKMAAFTLVELLVVIGIIAVLISILLPALSKARQASQSVACQSNIRQLLLASQMYINDNQSYMPAYDMSNWTGPKSWWQTLAKYVAPTGFNPNPNLALPSSTYTNYISAYNCPTAAKDLWSSTDADAVAGEFFWFKRCPVTYQISYYASDAQPYVSPISAHTSGPHFDFYQYTKITNWRASSFILFADSLPHTFWVQRLSRKAYSPYLGKANSDINFSGSVAFYHGSDNNIIARSKSLARANVGFLDGHVESLSAEEFIRSHLSPENSKRCYGWSSAATLGNIAILP